MYVRDEYDFSILKRAEEILNEKFDWNIKDDEFTGFINEDICGIIDSLCDEIIRLQEEYNKLEQDLEDNYKRIPVNEQYEISDRDFI